MGNVRLEITTVDRGGSLWFPNETSEGIELVKIWGSVTHGETIHQIIGLEGNGFTVAEAIISALLNKVLNVLDASLVVEINHIKVANSTAKRCQPANRSEVTINYTVGGRMLPKIITVQGASETSATIAACQQLVNELAGFEGEDQRDGSERSEEDRRLVQVTG